MTNDTPEALARSILAPNRSLKTTLQAVRARLCPWIRGKGLQVSKKIAEHTLVAVQYRCSELDLPDGEIRPTLVENDI